MANDQWKMIRVLLVDDEPSIRLTMAEFLKRAGYSVFTAADYNGAVVYNPQDLDVAVIDINLPGKNGIQLLQKIRDAEIYVPVIMITGEPNLSVIPEIVRAGAYDFIAKPIVKDVLLNAVGRAAEKKRLIDEKRGLEEEIRRHTEELEMRVAERTAELVETHKRLVTQERIAALGRAAAQVAHEVKNPLAGLLLYSLHLREMLEKPSPQAALVDKIVDTINHLNRRVEHILGFFSLESGAGRRVPLATWTWDCGRLAWLGHVGHGLGDLLHALGGRVPVLAIHPTDLANGFWPTILSLTEKLLESGHTPATVSALAGGAAC